ncbi:flagellin [Magnetospirillum molischianum]|uniref:Flagellin n=1 Tax=Magnetospirillum molischianum DSM 120 TaxID=1150626 RepID=H8FWB8_MAGML|nr:flagellin [Magnetospirillum molischianum]CCG42656.1 putative flagellin [Magnetospirillum molischianum DSM 120]
MPVISTNTASNSALRYLNINSANQSSTLSKLASGSRITKASDDAAGLAIGVRIQSDVTVLNQAATSASQGQSILQTADGGLARIGDILQRMKSLATKSNSGTVTDKERPYLQAEFKELQGEIDTIAKSTRYNGVTLLNKGDADNKFEAGVDFMLGTSASDTIKVTIPTADTTTLALPATVVISTQADAQTTIPLIDAAINMISSARANIGALESRFDFQAQTIATSTENLSAAGSVIMDADVAAEKSQLSSDDVKTQAAIAALSQANQMPQNLLSLLKS